MSDWNGIGFAPQGWQCPVCGAVYSPMTMQCFNCTGWKTSNKESTSTDDIDTFRKYLNHSAIKSTEEQENR